MKAETKAFFNALGMKTFAFFGYTFFSSFVALQILKLDKELGERLLLNLIIAGLSAGFYFFSELYKYYGLQPEKKVCTTNSKIKYSFII